MSKEKSPEKVKSRNKKCRKRRFAVKKRLAFHYIKFLETKSLKIFSLEIVIKKELAVRHTEDMSTYPLKISRVI
jgi:hypothetical protein